MMFGKDVNIAQLTVDDAGWFWYAVLFFTGHGWSLLVLFFADGVGWYWYIGHSWMVINKLLVAFPTDLG